MPWLNIVKWNFFRLLVNNEKFLAQTYPWFWILNWILSLSSVVSKMKSPKCKGNVVIKSDHPFTSKIFWAYVRRWQTELTLSDWLTLSNKKIQRKYKGTPKSWTFHSLRDMFSRLFFAPSKKTSFFQWTNIYRRGLLGANYFFWRARSSIFLLIPFVKVERTQQISRRFLPPRHFVSSLHFNQTDNSSTIRS